MTTGGHAEAAPAAWSLEVVAGPNTGAVIPLRSGRHSIGFDTANDIVLADNAVADKQAVLDIGRGAALFATAAGLVARGRAVDEGRGLKLRDDMTFVVGDTILRVHAPSRHQSRHWRATAAIIAAPVLLVCALFVVLSPHATTSATPSKVAARSDGGHPRAAAALQALTAQLASRGLANLLSLSVVDTAVHVRGRLTDAEMASWKQAERWYDTTYGSSPALVAQISSAELSLPDFGIAAVSTDDVPYVITTSNQRFTEGSVLPGGWVIAHIDSHEVTLTRDGQAVHMGL